ncbi:MAG: hypothetical protein GEU93_19250 [Propionibacteriales bacterium]|nr:hypothetical protein [Propionibacteriales bacterium]
MTSADPTTRVAALWAAAGLVAVEALALLAVAVSVAVSGSASRLMMNVTTTVFFVAVAAGLLVCAAGLLRLRRWARGPVVFAQLVQLGVAWSFRESNQGLSSVLAIVAVVVLGCVLSKRATRALVDETT